MEAAAISEGPPRLAPARRWRIHLGAHKTATTHLQETLAVMRPQLAARGLDFIPNPALRAAGLARDVVAPPLAGRLPLLRRRALARSFAATIDPLRGGPDTVLVSEENLIGIPYGLLTEPIYRNAERNVARLATLGAGAEVTFCLSIRAFDTLLPSAYVEALKVAPPDAGGFEAVRRRALARPPSWLELVRRLRRAVPGLRLRVWRQEDYRAHRAEILAAFCGVDLGPIPEVSDPDWTRSPGLEAVRAAEALPRELTRAERRERVKAGYLASPDDAPRFRPFAPQEAAVLREAYARDLAGLAALDPDMLLRFVPDAPRGAADAPRAAAADPSRSSA